MNGDRVAWRLGCAVMFVLLLGGCAANSPYLDRQQLPRSGYVFWQNERVMIAGPFAQSVEATYRRLADLAQLAVPLRIDGAKTINAFARRHKGEKAEIVINAGLLDLFGRDLDAIAFVLAHELGHLALQHLSDAAHNERAEQNRRWELVSMLADVVIPFSGMALSAGRVAQQASYSREQELDADRYGVALMQRAGYDPAGALRFQQQLMAIDDPSQLNLLSSHPPGKARIEALEHLLIQRQHSE